MGNMIGNKQNWGLIHNDTQNNLFFCIHQTPENPFAQITEKVQKSNFSISKQQIIKMIFDIDGVNQIPSKRLGISGLDNLKMNGSQRISIIFENGKIFLAAAIINNKDDIRMKITKQLGTTTLNADQVQKLKLIATGMKTTSIQICYQCLKENIQAKSNFFTPKNRLNCSYCNKVLTKGWVCQMFPLNHVFCDECHKMGLMSTNKNQDDNLNVKLVKSDQQINQQQDEIKWSKINKKNSNTLNNNQIRYFNQSKVDVQILQNQ